MPRAARVRQGWTHHPEPAMSRELLVSSATYFLSEPLGTVPVVGKGAAFRRQWPPLSLPAR